jgi:ADP-ribosylglycohydrolase
VPEAIVAFLDSTDFEDAIRNAVSLVGDPDTLTCITGGIAEAFYSDIPEHIRQSVWERLDEPLKQVVEEFRDRYC